MPNPSPFSTIVLLAISVLTPPAARAQNAQPGAAAVNLPVCAGSPVVDDTPMLISVIRNSAMNTFYVSPKAPCYVHFTGANALPAGITLTGAPGRSILRLFTGDSAQVAVTDNLMFINNPNITIEGLSIDADTASLKGYQNALIFVANTSDFRFMHNTILTTYAGGTRGIALWAYNTSATIDDNDFSGYETQTEVTADPGKSPRVTISKNRLHDNNSTGGNAIYISSTNQNKSELPVTVESNFIWNINATSWSSGQTGNAISVYLANRVKLVSNDVQNTAFSCFRANSSDYLTATGNHCEGARDSGAYSEFSSQHNEWVNNYFENSGHSCLNLTNYDAGGQFHSAIGNHMVHCGGAGIEAEANSIVMSNTIDQSVAGIVLGYGSYGKNVIAKNNLITDSSGENITQFGIGIESGTSGGMEVEGNQIDLSTEQVAGTSYMQIANGGALPATVTIRNQSVPYRQLGVPANGSVVYCPDCRVGPACGGGGTGAFAKRIAGTWVCQ